MSRGLQLGFAVSDDGIGEDDTTGCNRGNAIAISRSRPAFRGSSAALDGKT